jgi:hypothetical protein
MAEEKGLGKKLWGLSLTFLGVAGVGLYVNHLNFMNEAHLANPDATVLENFGGWYANYLGNVPGAMEGVAYVITDGFIPGISILFNALSGVFAASAVAPDLTLQ